MNNTTKNNTIETIERERKNVHYQFIIILGCQRSGTTLTGQILGNNTKTFLIDETDGDGMCLWFKKWLKNPILNDEAFLEVQKESSKKYNTQEKKVGNSPISTSFSIVLKAPNLTLLPSLFTNLFPKPIIVFPIRDVRSVVASMINLNKAIMINRQSEILCENNYICMNYPQEIELLQSCDTPLHKKAAIVWVLKTSMYEVFKTYGLNPYSFKYEDLILKKSPVFTILTKHCNLAHEESMLTYHLSMKGKGPGKTLRERKIDTRSLNKWQNNLTPMEIDDVMSVSQNQMHKLGYL